MRNIIYSCLGQTDSVYTDCLQLMIEEADNYAKNFKVKGLLSDTERKYFKYFINTYESSHSLPTKDLFYGMFPGMQGELDDNVVQIQARDFRVYIFNVLDARINLYISKRMSTLQKLIAENGITQEISDELNRLEALSNRNKAKDVSIQIDAKSEYENVKSRPAGLQTGIKAVDDKIGGMSPGTVTTIAGFTGQFKSTWGMNIAHINSYYLGYNICVISLEMPKRDVYFNLLSCHSYLPTLSRFSYVGHEKMRRGTMTKDEEDFIFNEVEPDMTQDYLGDDGKVHPRGKVVILDESDFKTFSFGEVTAVLEKVDDLLGGQLDAVIVDYVQLCKFSGTGISSDANNQINAYVTFFRRLAQNFRKMPNKEGEDSIHRLTMILLAQINRTSWQKASKNDGVYDVTCLADANELERGSSLVLTTYTSEELKMKGTAQVQILKNRMGQTMYEPSQVYVNGEAYVFQDEDTGVSSFGSDGTASIDSALGMFDDSDLDSLL